MTAMACLHGKYKPPRVVWPEARAALPGLRSTVSIFCMGMVLPAISMLQRRMGM